MSKTTTKTPKMAHKASAKIRYEASGRNLTSQAGLIPVIKFLDARGFCGLFHSQVHHVRTHNAQYLVPMPFGQGGQIDRSAHLALQCARQAAKRLGSPVLGSVDIALLDR